MSFSHYYEILFPYFCIVQKCPARFRLLRTYGFRACVEERIYYYIKKDFAAAVAVTEFEV